MWKQDIEGWQVDLRRTCGECGQNYTVREYIESSTSYFPPPYDYISGCERYCLRCWLGVGTDDFSNEDHERLTDEISGVGADLSSNEHYLPEGREVSSLTVQESFIEEGNLKRAYQSFLQAGLNLAIMPIDRLILDDPVRFPDGITLFPSGHVSVDQLNLVQNQRDSTSISELSSAASGITTDVLDDHPLVVFPYRFDWAALRRGSHQDHLKFIRSLSEKVDRLCLNFLRYRLCRLEPTDTLPAHAGQVASNHMMAGALLYNGLLDETRMIAGAAFNHYLTLGLGLNLAQIPENEFVKDGEIGKIVKHALSLYTSLLESNNPTARFMQALSLLEFLAYPDEYRQFKEVSKVIARYITKTPSDYHRTLDRFLELTGKKDDNGVITGYRTRVVHIGQRLEEIVPSAHSRSQLFLELDGYIRTVIDHMIEHSELSFEDYLVVRRSLRPFDELER